MSRLLKSLMLIYGTTMLAGCTVFRAHNYTNANQNLLTNQVNISRYISDSEDYFDISIPETISVFVPGDEILETTIQTALDGYPLKTESLMTSETLRTLQFRCVTRRLPDTLNLTFTIPWKDTYAKTGAAYKPTPEEIKYQLVLYNNGTYKILDENQQEVPSIKLDFKLSGVFDYVRAARERALATVRHGDDTPQTVATQVNQKKQAAQDAKEKHRRAKEDARIAREAALAAEHDIVEGVINKYLDDMSQRIVAQAQGHIICALRCTKYSYRWTSKDHSAIRVSGTANTYINGVYAHSPTFSFRATKTGEEWQITDTTKY